MYVGIFPEILQEYFIKFSIRTWENILCNIKEISDKQAEKCVEEYYWNTAWNIGEMYVGIFPGILEEYSKEFSFEI